MRLCRVSTHWGEGVQSVPTLFVVSYMLKVPALKATPIPAWLVGGWLYRQSTQPQKFREAEFLH